MANKVYANGREISCKAADGKAICAFPDVCLSPPSPPAGPLPIPYPNTGFAKDTTSGSKTVKISNKEVMLKNKSYFKKSTGDEACTKSFGMGVITHQHKGKVYFNSWSSDIKVEGKNAVRHLDLTTHNHAAAQPGQTPPWPYADGMALAPGGVCHEENQKIKNLQDNGECKPDNWMKNCPPDPPKCPPKGSPKAARQAYYSEFTSFSEKCNADPCIKARRCMLVPYKPDDPNGGCCPGQTGDHLIDAASFLGPKEYKGQHRNKRPKIEGWGNYDVDKAPCVCAEGPNYHTATHGQLHTRRGVVALHAKDSAGQWSCKDASKTGAKAVCKTFPKSGCSEECIEKQLNDYHDKARKPAKPEKPVKASHSMAKKGREEAMAEMGVVDRGITVPKPTVRKG